MHKNKNCRFFISNYWHVIRLWAFGIIALLICIVFIMTSLPLWAILLVGSVALVLFVTSIIATVILRCKISNDGITVAVSGRLKQFFSWNDFNSVKIKCKHLYDNVYMAGYSVELKSDSLSIKIKTYSDVIEAIKEFSKDSEKFQSMFLESLREVEKTC